uniref:Uncharacterized protein n=1 Tax=Oryza punctata TaxID=4537 RepID=A0A0E0MNA9_ORYPU
MPKYGSIRPVAPPRFIPLPPPRVGWRIPNLRSSRRPAATPPPTHTPEIQGEHQVVSNDTEGTEPVDQDSAGVDLGQGWFGSEDGFSRANTFSVPVVDLVSEAKKKEDDVEKERQRAKRYRVAFALDQQCINLEKEKFEF